MTQVPGTGGSGVFDSQPDWAVPPGTGITVQREDITAACSTTGVTISPRDMVKVTVTVDVPGTIDVSAFEGGGSTSPVAADRPANDSGPISDSCVLACCGGSGSTLPVARDLPSSLSARVAKCTTRKVHGHKHKVCGAVTLAHLRTTFTSRGGKVKLRVPLSHSGKVVFKRLRALDKAYFKKHHHGHHAPRLKLRVKITFTPKV